MDGEIGTTNDGVLYASGGNVIHLSMKQVGLLDGLDVYLSLDPFGALPCDTFLLELVRKLQASSVNDEGLCLGLTRVEPMYKGRLAEEEVEVFDAVEFFLEGVVSIDGEVGRDDRELRATLHLLAQKIGDRTSRVVVAQAGGIGIHRHGVAIEFLSGFENRAIYAAMNIGV